MAKKQLSTVRQRWEDYSRAVKNGTLLPDGTKPDLNNPPPAPIRKRMPRAERQRMKHNNAVYVSNYGRARGEPYMNYTVLLPVLLVSEFKQVLENRGLTAREVVKSLLQDWVKTGTPSLTESLTEINDSLESQGLL